MRSGEKAQNKNPSDCCVRDTVYMLCGFLYHLFNARYALILEEITFLFFSKEKLNTKTDTDRVELLNSNQKIHWFHSQALTMAKKLISTLF